MLFTDLREVKSILEIADGNTAEDKAINFYVEYASALIEEFLNRPNQFSKKQRTEYYDGTGTVNLNLRCRPVYQTPTIQVWADRSGYYGENTSPNDAPFLDNTELVYGRDFGLRIDQEDGTSRSGILFSIRGYWYRPVVRQSNLLAPFVDQDKGSIKVIYTAGYTVDTLPPVFRLACNLLVARLRYIMPLGMELTSESYEERAISVNPDARHYLLSLIKPLLMGYKNWRF